MTDRPGSRVPHIGVTLAWRSIPILVMPLGLVACNSTLEGGDVGEGYEAFAACMRDQGANVGQPVLHPDGSVSLPPGEGDLTPREELIEAGSSCQPVLSARGLPSPGPVVLDQTAMQQLKQRSFAFAGCVRESGIDWPDPTWSGGAITNWDPWSLGLDLTDPRLQHAGDDCAEQTRFDPLLAHAPRRRRQVAAQGGPHDGPRSRGRDGKHTFSSHPPAMIRWVRDASILHVDLDAFYASVEQLLRPELRGKPVLVGGGVVLAASYEARACGVSAPMGIRQARALCPGAVVVSGSFDRYSPLSDQVMEICRDMTPLVERVSIDEAFLDVSGSVHLLGSPLEIGQRIRQRVRAEVGLPISVGIASTKFLAKIASAQAKPDGLLAVAPEVELGWLHALPIGAMWGVGAVTGKELSRWGISTVGELARTERGAIQRILGRGAGRKLHDLAWNRDQRGVRTGGRAGSVGAQSALGQGLSSDHDLSRVLLALAERVGGRLRAKQRAGRTVTLRVRFTDMSSLTRAATLSAAVATTAALHRTALALLSGARKARGGPVTLLGISVSRLESAGPLQLELPFPPGDPTHPGSPGGVAQLSVDEQVDLARARYGRQAVGRASVLLEVPRRSVPDAFRELAERD